MTTVKICGITNIADAVAAVEEGADLLGFVLSPSPRRVTPEKLEAILSAIGTNVSTVGVFATAADLGEYDSSSLPRLDLYQVYFSDLPHVNKSPRKGWIHAQMVNNGDGISFLPERKLFLLDFKQAGREYLDKQLPRQSSAMCEFGIIAGGLDVDNVAEVTCSYSPFGVDVARGVESSPGIKDHRLMRRFIRRAKGLNA